MRLPLHRGGDDKGCPREYGSLIVAVDALVAFLMLLPMSAPQGRLGSWQERLCPGIPGRGNPRRGQPDGLELPAA